MSGHNKWSTIKRKKGAIDAKRSKIFSKIIKEIAIAIKEGGTDPDGNARLRLALNNAKGANMPKENIQRALTKAADKNSIQEVSYEGYGPNGIAIFVDCLTDNTQRTVSNIRSLFNKRGGSLGTNGSLSFLFDRKGVITIPKGSINMDEFELEIIDAGAEDIEVTDDEIIVTTAKDDFSKVQKKLEQMGIEPENAELRRVPNDTKTLDVNAGVRILKLVEEFEEDDDVSDVYHNLEVTEEIMNAFEEA